MAHQNNQYRSPTNRRPRILLGITGSVAAVKGPKLALRLANELNADVKVILTRTVEQCFWKEGRAVPSYDEESWRDFLAASSSSATSSSGDADGEDCDWRASNGSISIHYAEEEWANYKSLQDTVLHIDLRNWADICLIAPLTAHTLAKIANGLCDDLLTCCMRAWDFGQRQSLANDNNNNIISRPSIISKPVILAPAMNTAMWDHPLTRIQLETIQKFTGAKKMISDGNDGKDENGVIIVEPAVKTLACGDVGAGALAELDDIVFVTKRCLIQWDTDGSSRDGNSDDKESSSPKKRWGVRIGSSLKGIEGKMRERQQLFREQQLKTLREQEEQEAERLKNQAPGLGDVLISKIQKNGTGKQTAALTYAVLESLDKSGNSSVEGNDGSIKESSVEEELVEEPTPPTAVDSEGIINDNEATAVNEDPLPVIPTPDKHELQRRESMQLLLLESMEKLEEEVFSGVIHQEPKESTLSVFREEHKDNDNNKTSLENVEEKKLEDSPNENNDDSSSAEGDLSRKESMKRALLLHAKQKFIEMKSSHEQQSTTAGPNSSSSSSQLAAPISPTPNLIIEAFLPRLNLDSNSLLVDLGCGDGRWLIAANKHTKCKCLGIDVDEERLKLAQEYIVKNELEEQVKVRQQDVFDFVKKCDDMYEADVIVVYLFREAMVEIGALLQERLSVRDDEKDASRKTVQILSVGFALSGLTLVDEEKINGIRVYLYSME